MIIPRHISLFGRIVDLANIDCHWFALDATLWLQWLYVLSGAAFAMGWWPCHGCGKKCSHCKDSKAPSQVQLDVDNVIDDGCSRCDEVLNTTFILDFTCEDTDICYWLAELGANDICNDAPADGNTECSDTMEHPYVRLTVDSGTDVNVRFTYHTVNNGTLSINIPGGDDISDDCDGWSSVELTHGTTGLGQPCNLNSATIFLTAT